MIFTTQWSDGGALMAGKKFGKTPFASSISPTKTWEGVAGAILLPLLVVNPLFWALGQYSDGKYALKMPLLDYMLIALMCAPLSILGDLIESFLKRCSNLKDSSNLMPEHGGMLDRLDSMLLNFPFLYWYSLEYLDYTHSPGYDFDKVHLFQYFRWF